MLSVTLQSFPTITFNINEMKSRMILCQMEISQYFVIQSEESVYTKSIYYCNTKTCIESNSGRYFCFLYYEILKNALFNSQIPKNLIK